MKNSTWLGGKGAEEVWEGGTAGGRVGPCKRTDRGHCRLRAWGGAEGMAGLHESRTEKGYRKLGPSVG